MRLQAIMSVLAAVVCAASISADCASQASALGIVISPFVSVLSAVSSKGADAETPKHAARRLFPYAYRVTMSTTKRPDVLKDAVVGAPQPVSLDYSAPGYTLASWIVPDDTQSATTGMFAAMCPSPMSDHRYIVPMVKDGRSVCEFEMARYKKGRWEAVSMLIDPLPGGNIYDSEVATAELQTALGAGTAVRIAVFLPSGLVFAVGSNGCSEAGVYLTFITSGPGITSFNKNLPRTGRLFTPNQLAQLLTP